jgi:hypothetical protein
MASLNLQGATYKCQRTFVYQVAERLLRCLRSSHALVTPALAFIFVVFNISSTLLKGLQLVITNSRTN